MDGRVGNLCTRDVVTVKRETSIAQAAALMRKHHVGAVVMVDGRHGAQVAAGILTDRDITIEVVAAGLDASTLTVGEVVQRPVASVTPDTPYSMVVRAMAAHGVRRLPVVNRDGSLAGIVSLDDVLIELVAPLVAVSELSGRERRIEQDTRAS